MKHILTLLLLAGLFTSCSTAYKAAQTPDDVYYSPARERADKYQTYASRDRYQENINYQDDRFLRMKVRNPDRWNQIDDYGYWNDSRFDYFSYNNYNSFNNNYLFSNRFNRWYGYNNFTPGFGFNGFGYNNCFSPNYYGYGGLYSPVYPVVYYRSPKVYSGVTGKSNLATYLNTRYNNSNTNFNKGDARNDNLGNMVRRVFAPSPDGNNNNNNNSFDRPARTTNSTSAPSNSAGGNSGGYNSSGSSSSSSRPPRN